MTFSPWSFLVKEKSNYNVSPTTICLNMLCSRALCSKGSQKTRKDKREGTTTRLFWLYLYHIVSISFAGTTNLSEKVHSYLVWSLQFSHSFCAVSKPNPVQREAYKWQQQQQLHKWQTIFHQKWIMLLQRSWAVKKFSTVSLLFRFILLSL